MHRQAQNLCRGEPEGQQWLEPFRNLKSPRTNGQAQTVIKPQNIVIQIYNSIRDKSDAAGTSQHSDMALVFDPACEGAVADVRNDSTATNWVSFKYEGRNKLVVGAKGNNG